MDVQTMCRGPLIFGDMFLAHKLDSPLAQFNCKISAVLPTRQNKFYLREFKGVCLVSTVQRLAQQAQLFCVGLMIFTAMRWSGRFTTHFVW
jgi:hypothetical protein